MNHSSFFGGHLYTRILDGPWVCVHPKTVYACLCQVKLVGDFNTLILFSNFSITLFSALPKSHVLCWQQQIKMVDFPGPSKDGLVPGSEERLPHWCAKSSAVPRLPAFEDDERFEPQRVKISFRPKKNES